MKKTDHQELSVWVLVHAEYRKGLRYYFIYLYFLFMKLIDIQSTLFTA